MIIDSSALVAIVLKEADFMRYIERISEATSKRMSAASLLETSIIVNRAKGSAGVEILRRFLSEAGVQVVAFDEGQARLAFEAHLRFGKGMGHPAQLNILDCCTYALAAELGEPVLFKGADFGVTDLSTVE